MRQKSMGSKSSAEATVRDIRRRTCKQYSAEEKIRIVLAGPGEAAELLDVDVDHVAGMLAFVATHRCGRPQIAHAR